MASTLGKCAVGLIIAAAMSLATPPVWAQIVQVGKHSKDEIKSACGKVGGQYTDGGTVWSCYNPTTGNAVYCDASGCRGNVSPKTAKAASKLTGQSVGNILTMQ